MNKDPIVEQIREIRRQTEEACGQDWQKLFEHFLKVQKSSGRPTFRGSPKRLMTPRKK